MHKDYHMHVAGFLTGGGWSLEVYAISSLSGAVAVAKEARLAP